MYTKLTTLKNSDGEEYVFVLKGKEALFIGYKGYNKILWTKRAVRNLNDIYATIAIWAMPMGVSISQIVSKF